MWAPLLPLTNSCQRFDQDRDNLEPVHDPRGGGKLTLR
ncbi:hypothetical protein B0O95_104147 [Mycetohabitans endofungorum]|uniref:Uncharacterized protein n=1 Tax=Mycetohabitans endofungorum TaxID=417203 RepID=A0A2P5KC16_9BURK|nr:hypothetical protein B0O95_104147 [Mycetohabitans endofungorum]